MVANILPTDTPSTQGVGSKGQTIYFSESSRSLTRILKTGVQDSHLAKSRSPTGKKGSPTPKKLESHQFVHTLYLFHFCRK